MQLQEELYYQYLYEKSGVKDRKDIIIVVHDQLEYIRKCINSLYENTENFTLYLWDNNSLGPTKEYLQDLTKKYENVILERSEDNLGFIIPNNRLAEKGRSPFVILLNSDTEVRKGWDEAMIGWLLNSVKFKLVGYEGGRLQPDGKGSGKAYYGKEIDYVCGWCCCLERETIRLHGLFDEKNLKFAYGEDSDLSLRLKEQGYEIYALHLNLLKHYGNVTAREVDRERNMSDSFNQNHLYICQRHGNYLKNRILL